MVAVEGGSGGDGSSTDGGGGSGISSSGPKFTVNVQDENTEFW